jgi:hypothetical protein
MQIKKPLIAAALALALTFTGSAAASAAPSTQTGETGRVVALVTDSNGKLIPVDQALGSTGLGLKTPPPSSSGGAHPALINFDQWFRCFSLNAKEDVFSEYAFYMNGNFQNVRLKCGDQPANSSGWGYKHIRAGKEGLWQKQLDAAKSKGWQPTTQGVEGWDDLMNIGAGTAVTYWGYASPVKGNNTRCTISTVTFGEVSSNGSWKIVYSFKAAAVFSVVSDRLITAYPIDKSTC